MTEAAPAYEADDTVTQMLCLRNDELQAEKDALATQVDRLEEQLAMLRSQADALHRIGSTLDLDPGTDLTQEAPARVKALVAFRSAVCGWRESDWPVGFCRLTAELVADHGRQAEGGDHEN